MRILMFNNEFPPLGGGTSTVNLMLFREWATAESLEIDLITTGSRDMPRREAFAGNITIHRVPVGQKNPHHATNLNLIIYTLRALAKGLSLRRAAGYDLTMGWHAVPAGALSLCFYAAFRIPYLIRTGGSDIPGHEKRYARLTRLLTPLIRAVWNRAGAVVVKCDREWQGVNGIAPSAVLKSIPNGVDTEAFTPAPRTDGPLRLIIVARLIEHKGHRILFDAVRKARDAGIDLRVDVVGTGDAEQAYRAYCRNLDLEGTVSFTGYVPREDIAEHYRRADIFVLPSEGEGMSISTLEAMASGLALLVTPTGGMETLVSEGVNGLTFAPGDIEALYAHIRDLASDLPRVQAMGQASREKARQHAWPNAAEAYRELFAAICPGN